MHRSQPSRRNGGFALRKSNKRRPSGISRRRKRQLGFESLEVRQVMSAQSPLEDLVAQVRAGLQAQTQSYSSNTIEGQLAQLYNELAWQALIANAGNAAGTLSPRSIPTDPLFGNQWHLINSGQQVGNPNFQPIFAVPGIDLNVAPLFNQGYDGSGIVIAIIDTGVQTTHPDLMGNLDLARQFDANTGLPNGNPTGSILNPNLAHGTAVAGIIGAIANNGIGGSGVAPGVTMIPIQFNGGSVQIAAAFENALRYSLLQGVDITNNSFGPSDFIRTLAGPTAAQLDALRDSVFFGRDLDGPGGNPALGMINIWAAGNGAADSGRPGFPGRGVFDSSNYDGFANSRYTIAVGAVDHDGSYNNVDGTVTNLFEGGANVLVVALSGSGGIAIANDTNIGSGITTTDLLGDLGYNQSPDPIFGTEFDGDFLADTNYTSRFGATSGAAAMVSGVVALMLQANPNLSWRDVQEILVRSARQNDQFSLPSNGAGFTTESTWITNQRPLYHPPDAFNGNPVDEVYRPLLDPNAPLGIFGNFDGRGLSDHFAASPFRFTNGAGYTVSQGTGAYGEQIGYGHGLVDAELAVRMAEQWHVKNQALPGELTFTTFVNSPGNVPFNLPAAERGDEDSGFIVVPGGIGGLGGHIAWVNEYFADEPDFSDLTYDRGAPAFQFSVPSNNLMSIESIDVKITLDPDSNAAEALDHLRLMLVSPEGTSSELNTWWHDTYGQPFTTQSLSNGLTQAQGLFGDPGSITADGQQFVWTFNTNRSWGERSDDRILFDPVTNEPVVDLLGVSARPGQPATIGAALMQGWKLVVENWDANDAFGLQGVEIAWHGSPLAAGSQRVQGFVGVDDNRDALFNYTRYNQTDAGAGTAPRRLGDVRATADLTLESFGANVTVSVYRNDNGQRGALVDQFVTGHDGNFYFDLVPDSYIIAVEDASGRSALDDTVTPAGLLDHYRSEWHIDENYFRVWDHDPNFINEVLADADGNPIAWRDQSINQATQLYGMRGINFLLDPGAPVLQQAVFTGTVSADVNGDGLFNGDDVVLPNITVFGDINRNGQRDPGEVTAVTNANGQFTLTQPLTAGSVLNIGVVRPPNWTSTSDGPSSGDSATDGLEPFFAQPGNTFSGLSFSLKPPANNLGGGGVTQNGFLMGVVYNDVNNNGSRQAGEEGAANVTVYIDSNNSGVIDLGDIVTTTNANGAFVFANVTPGQKVIRTSVGSPLVQTSPAPGQGRIVTLAGSSTISNIQFGIRNTATLDWGDLPLEYGMTTAAQNGARHTVSSYYLGAPGSKAVDAELDGQPSIDARGDDILAPLADEDGITFDPIVPGTSVRIVVQASASGFLQGWIDWNADFKFDGPGERVFNNQPLVTGNNVLFVNVPADAKPQVYARFRFGGAGLGLQGPASYGEVEDYRLNVAVPVLPQIQGLAADTDQDGDVDGADFLTWQRNIGRTNATQAQGDADGDGVVGYYDLVEMRQSFGDSTASATAPQSADFDGDGDVDGADFLALQRGLGSASATRARGDANGDGLVNSADMAIWSDNFGDDASALAAAATITVEASASTAHQLAPFFSQVAGASLAVAPTVASDGQDDATSARVDGATSRRESFVELARAMRAGEPLASGRLAAIRELAETAIDRAGGGREIDVAGFLRRDRAFEDLFGTRRRQGLADEQDAEAPADEADCDEAFAAFADHFDLPPA